MNANLALLLPDIELSEKKSKYVQNMAGKSAKLLERKSANWYTVLATHPPYGLG